MRLHLSRHLLPALNQSGHFVSERSVQKDDRPTSPALKRRRLSDSVDGSFLSAKDLKKVHKHVIATVDLQLLLMERMEGVIISLPMDDQQVLMLTSGVLPAFQVDIQSTLSNTKESFQAQQLHTTSISILTAVFRKYPMHRDIIIEDLFPIMLNLPTSKRSLRTFPVQYTSSPSTTLQAMNVEVMESLLHNGATPHFIQSITALVLSLVHSCVLKPTYGGAKRPSVNYDNKLEATSENVQSGLRSSIMVADTFVRLLLKRCTKSKGDTVSEYRPVLTNMVEDLLLVLIIPEYPAAELLLAALQRRFNHDLTAASPIFSSSTKKHPVSPPEATYLNCIMDVMGKICSVQARLLAVAEEKPIGMVTEASLSNARKSEEGVDCLCKSKHADVLQVQCERCNSIFHGVCVGLPDAESIPEEWVCDRCVLGRIITREQEKINEPAHDGTILNRVFAMRYAFQSATSHQMRVVDSKVDDPIKFHLARWIDEINLTHVTVVPGSCQPKQYVMAKLLDYWDSDTGVTAESLSDEGIVRVIVNMMTQTSQFFLSFRKQIEFLVKHMSDDNPQMLRKLSLKIIEKVCQILNFGTDINHFLQNSLIAIYSA
jgi:cohesin loading factor subunit SCC2